MIVKIRNKNSLGIIRQTIFCWWYEAFRIDDYGWIKTLCYNLRNMFFGFVKGYGIYK